MKMNYILDVEGEPVGEPDLMKWARWFETTDRKVALDFIGEARISTVFLGIDHNFSGQGAPILWETMIFGGDLDQEQSRCSGSRLDAQRMHDKMVKKLRIHINKNNWS